jgi:hypothetical protein
VLAMVPSQVEHLNGQPKEQQRVGPECFSAAAGTAASSV